MALSRLDSVILAGYDMEDAMILNKSAVERGLGHATMIKTEQVDLSKESGMHTGLPAGSSLAF